MTDKNLLKNVVTKINANLIKLTTDETSAVMMMMNCFKVWLTDERHLALFPAGVMIRDAHHPESPTRHDQGLNLRRIWVQALLNEVVQ